MCRAQNLGEFMNPRHEVINEVDVLAGLRTSGATHNPPIRFCVPWEKSIHSTVM